MTFINPIEILALEEVDVSLIDNALIKKAKRKVQAEIDLSDSGMFNYKGVDITKAECERVIDELEDINKKEYYWIIADNKPLNNFLSVGDEQLFSSFKQESIYKNQAFVNFVSPYFSERFNKSFFRAFKINDITKVLSILQTEILLNQSDFNIAFRDVSMEIQNRISYITTLKEEINNDTSSFTVQNIQQIVPIIEKSFPIEILNNLPYSYFESQISKIASRINSLQLAIDNKFSNTKICLNLIEIALNLNIESLGKDFFLKNRGILAKRLLLERENEKNAPILAKWAFILSNIKKCSVSVKDKSLHSSQALNQVAITISNTELNGLGDFANEIRNQIARALRELSVDIWNSQGDINNSIAVIKKALAINSSSEIKTFLNETKSELDELKRKIDETQTLTYQRAASAVGAPNKNYIKEKDSSPIRGIIAIIFLMLIFFNALKNCSNSSASDDTSSNISTNYTSDSTTIAPTPAYQESPNNSSNNVKPKVPEYLSLPMTNGNITGCKVVKSKYDQNINNRLEISVGYNANVAVKMINYQTQECIRYVYINKGSNYTIRHIPEGRYYLKIAYGDDWGVKKGQSKCDGKFMSDVLYKKGDEVLDYYFVNEGDNYSVPSYSLKLDVIRSLSSDESNYNSDNISEDEFSK